MSCSFPLFTLNFEIMFKTCSESVKNPHFSAIIYGEMYNYLINIEELTVMSVYHGICLFIKMVAGYLLVAGKTY